jgi:hypothetical protein
VLELLLVMGDRLFVGATDDGHSYKQGAARSTSCFCTKRCPPHGTLNSPSTTVYFVICNPHPLRGEVLLGCSHSSVCNLSVNEYMHELV